MILLFTDGSCISNPGGKSGWAYVAATEDGKRLCEEYGCIENGTNNIAELTACIHALRTATELRQAYPGNKIILVSDSRYVLGGLPQSDEWGRDRDRPNHDLWQLAYEALADVGARVYLKWVKGHAGNPNNERCDKLAYKAAKKQVKGKWNTTKTTG